MLRNYTTTICHAICGGLHSRTPPRAAPLLGTARKVTHISARHVQKTDMYITEWQSVMQKYATQDKQKYCGFLAPGCPCPSAGPIRSHTHSRDETGEGLEPPGASERKRLRTTRWPEQALRAVERGHAQGIARVMVPVARRVGPPPAGSPQRRVH